MTKSNTPDFQHKTQALQSWILRNQDEFRPSVKEGRSLFSRYKATGELCLVLSAIVSSRGPAPRWARDMLNMLWHEIAALCGHGHQKKIAQAATTQINNVALWQLFLNLENLSGRKFSFHGDIIRNLSNWHKSVKDLPSPIAYTCELAGLATAQESAIGEIRKLINRPLSDYYPASELYLLTHSIFFGTDFGKRSLLNQEEADLVIRRLQDGLTSTTVQDNLDLVAEIVASLAFMKSPVKQDHPALLGLNRIITIYPQDGQVKLSDFALRHTPPTFHYHLVLTSLMALTHYNSICHESTQFQG